MKSQVDCMTVEEKDVFLAAPNMNHGEDNMRWNNGY